jgi:D-glycero-D-manno-heptose 1,7-bisphosphate phosphatase
MFRHNMKRRVAFLDRDGTINVDKGYVHRREDWEYCPGAVEAITILKRLGFAVAVISNQSGIARGLYSAEDAEALHAWVRSDLEARGAALDEIVYCPHSPKCGCTCRKPNTGLATRVQEALGNEIDYSRSWTIGDKASDIEFGARLGTETVLLASPYWSPEITSLPLLIAPDLLAAVTTYVTQSLAK